MKKRMVSIILVSASSLSFAQDSTEKIYQELLNDQNSIGKDIKAAADGDVEKAERIVNRELERFCSKDMPSPLGNEDYLKYCLPNGPKHRDLAIHFAKIRFETYQNSLKEYAKRLSQLNKLSEECSAGKSGFIEQSHPEVCQEKIVCSGDLAQKIQSLAENNFKSILEFTSTRELNDNEKTFDGIDLTPVFKDPKVSSVKLTHPDSFFSIVGSKEYTRKNEALERKLDQKMKELGQKISRNPKGLSQLLKGQDAFDSIEEARELVNRIDQVKDPKAIAELINQYNEELDDEEDEKEKVDPKDIQKFVENVKVAGDQITEMEAEMAKFYKKNQEALLNPVVKSNTYFSAGVSTVPDGVMTVRDIYCEKKNLTIGNVEKKNEHSCELVFSNSKTFKYETKNRGQLKKITRPVVENKCVKKSPLSFFKSLFGSKSNSKASLNDSDRTAKDVSAPLREKSEASSKANQE